MAWRPVDQSAHTRHMRARGTLVACEYAQRTARARARDKGIVNGCACHTFGNLHSEDCIAAATCMLCIYDRCTEKNI